MQVFFSVCFFNDFTNRSLPMIDKMIVQNEFCSAYTYYMYIQAKQVKG